MKDRDSYINIFRQEVNLRIQHVRKLIESCNKKEQLNNLIFYYNQLVRQLEFIKNKHEKDLSLHAGSKYHNEAVLALKSMKEQVLKEFRKMTKKLNIHE